MWHYYWLVIRRVQPGLVHRAEAVVFLCFIGVGLLLAVFPHLQHGQAIHDTIVSWTGAIWAVCAVVLTRLLVSPYYLWKEATDQNKELKDKLELRINCSFDVNDRLCVIPLLPDRTSLWLRMRVIASGVGILEHCSGRLVSVKKPDGGTIPLELQLPFSPIEKHGLDLINLVAGRPEYLDVLKLTDQNQVSIVALMPTSLDQDEVFKQEGLYEITVSITSGNSPPKEAKLLFYKHKDFVTTRSQFIQSRT